jgi:hypothetical protein
MRGRKMVGNNRRGKYSCLPIFFLEEREMGGVKDKIYFPLFVEKKRRKGRIFFLFNLFSGWEDLLYC